MSRPTGPRWVEGLRVRVRVRVRVRARARVEG